MEIKVFSEDEVHITCFNYLNHPYILFNGERFELVHYEMNKDTKKRTFMFVKNY